MQVGELGQHAAGVVVEFLRGEIAGGMHQTPETFEYLLMKSHVAGEVRGGVVAQLFYGAIDPASLMGEVFNDGNHQDSEDQQ